jgi:hypothetical protein
MLARLARQGFQGLFKRYYRRRCHTYLFSFKKGGSMKPVFLLGKMMAQDETSGKTSISGKINERLIKKYSIYNRRRKFQHTTLFIV